ncbi:MAG TPA: N-acetyl-gamma-glutamyl-phosphate reductase, partial [Myxococcota bacterium]|nr:N-acetyl-gamma-glutamyl-phosphate reductase [Myxococcota bacterium]
MTAGARLPVGVVGANGFLGGELVRLLSAHPRVEIAACVAGSSAGRSLGEVRPSLRGVDRVLESFDADALAARCAVVFLALPHGESEAAAAQLVPRGARVIDLGSDLRLRDPADARRWYKRDPKAPELCAEAFYGLPELTGAPPDGWRAIANPGCFATALAMLLAPLAPRLPAGAPVHVFGVTGSSGSGIQPSAGVHHALRATSFVAYKPLVHQHLGELGQLLGQLPGSRVPDVRFVPHSLPTARGIHLTAMIRRDDLDGDALELLRARYAGARLVDVGPGEVPMGAVQ